MSTHFQRGLLFASVALALAFAAACTETADDTTPTMSPTTAATATATTTPDAPAAPTAPTEVTITGAIPNLQMPVPEGEAETGRITVTWVAPAGNIDAYRIYTDCGSGPVLDLEVAGDELQYGPLNPCRPSEVGVTAVVNNIESEIAWGAPEVN